MLSLGLTISQRLADVRRAVRARLTSLPWRRVAAAAAVGTLVAVAMGLWLRLGPIDPALLDLGDSASTVVVDRRGVPLYEALSADGARSIHVAATALPPVLVDATLAAEDRRFWSHAGIDPIAIARATRQNLIEGQVVEGGSTITQQVAKLLLNRQSPKRVRGVGAKIREAILALRLEHRFDKREILAMYLNLAAYGNQIVGAGRASQAYFARDPSMLTPAQAAFLAGLPQRPSGYNPYRNRESATVRQRNVLTRMQAAGSLTAEQVREARDEQLTFARTTTPFLAPHFVEMVLANTGTSRPPRITTTLDAGLQSDVVGIIRSQQLSLERHGAANVAVVVLDNLRGEWLAWEGSGNYGDVRRGGAINGAVTPRQPGSALKPFTYALAFESGFTPATVLADIPSHFPTAEQGVSYTPRNYDGRYRGPLLARAALAGSENVPAVVVASQVGVPALLRFLNRAGLATFDRTPSYYGLGLTLGNAEVRLDQLVAAYSSFARGGDWLETAYLPSSDGAATRQRRRLVSPETAYWITDILSDDNAREYIFGRGGSLEFPFPVAVKTGTSQSYHDNWTVGYTRELTVGVWVGNFDRTPLRSSTGVTGAAPIFHAVMLAATRRLHGAANGLGSPTIVERPATLVQHEICALSGMVANPWCPTRLREWMPEGDRPSCSWHHLSDDGLLVFWPAEYRQWARQNGLMTDPGRAVPVKWTPSREVRPTPPTAPIAIVNPPADGVYLIDPTLRREFQTLALRAVTASRSTIEWHIDGRVIGSASSESPLMWPLATGKHTILARDEHGNTAQTAVVVK
jgi:penicillin-binding protein 1C